VLIIAEKWRDVNRLFMDLAKYDENCNVTACAAGKFLTKSEKKAPAMRFFA
jgi:hypothetical protein